MRVFCYSQTAPTERECKPRSHLKLYNNLHIMKVIRSFKRPLLKGIGGECMDDCPSALLNLLNLPFFISFLLLYFILSFCILYFYAFCYSAHGSSCFIFSFCLSLLFISLLLCFSLFSVHGSSLCRTQTQQKTQWLSLFCW